MIAREDDLESACQVPAAWPGDNREEPRQHWTDMNGRVNASGFTNSLTITGNYSRRFKNRG